MPIPNLDGIDVSHWNVVVDEAQIPRLPLMSCKATEGKQFVSPKFRDFWAMFARLEARWRGAYHWIRSDSTMQSQVDHLAKTLDSVGGLQPGDFVQLDWETTKNVPNVTAIQVEEWVELAQQRWGDRVIVYGAPWVPQFVDWRDRNPTTPVWLANYNTQLGPKGGWVGSSLYKAAVWQWSSTAKVPGFLWNPDDPADGIDVNHIWDASTLDRLCDLEVEADVLVKIKTPPAGSPGWWPYIGLFDSGAARPIVNDDVGVPTQGTQQLTDVGQYRRLATSIGIDLTDEFPDGSSGDPGGGAPVVFPPYVGTITLQPGE